MVNVPIVFPLPTFMFGIIEVTAVFVEVPSTSVGDIIRLEPLVGGWTD